MSDNEQGASNKRGRDEPKADSPAKRAKAAAAEAPRALDGGDGAVALRVTGGELLYGSWSGALLGAGKEASSSESQNCRVKALDGAWRVCVLKVEGEAHGFAVAHESLDDKALVERVKRAGFDPEEEGDEHLVVSEYQWEETHEEAAGLVGGEEAAERVTEFFGGNAVLADAARFAAAARPVIDEAARDGKVGGAEAVPSAAAALAGDAACTLDWNNESLDTMHGRVLLDAAGGAAHAFLVYDESIAFAEHEDIEVTLLGQAVTDAEGDN